MERVNPRVKPGVWRRQMWAQVPVYLEHLVYYKLRHFAGTITVVFTVGKKWATHAVFVCLVQSLKKMKCSQQKHQLPVFLMYCTVDMPQCTLKIAAYQLHA
jgi:hypothetical protein